MSEILSQDEIDKLLNAIASGDDAVESGEREKRIVSYNFARPSKFAKDQLRTLEIMFDNFARTTGSFLTGYLRTAVVVEVMSSEQVTYGEFSNSMINPVILAIMDFQPFKGNVLLELSAAVGVCMMDRLLGGEGKEPRVNKEFTEIEVALLNSIMEKIIDKLIEPWSQICEINPLLDKVETNAQFAQIISPNEMVALITLNIKIGEIEGLMNFCIPYIVIEPIVEHLNTKYWFSTNNDSNDETYQPHVERQLEKALVTVSALVGKTNVTIDEFIGIQVGDVIPLDSYVNSDLRIKVGEITKFYAKPGINRGKNAIQITSVIEGD
ncbi:MAG: flagellar motor switch protein FliM [bacterium]